MSTMVVELYDALKKAGVDEDTAKQAARSVAYSEGVATKNDLDRMEMKLRQDMSDLKTEIIKWNTGTLLAVTGLFALIVKLVG